MMASHRVLLLVIGVLTSLSGLNSLPSSNQPNRAHLELQRGLRLLANYIEQHPSDQDAVKEKMAAHLLPLFQLVQDETGEEISDEETELDDLFGPMQQVEEDSDSDSGSDDDDDDDDDGDDVVVEEDIQSDLLPILQLIKQERRAQEADRLRRKMSLRMLSGYIQEHPSSDDNSIKEDLAADILPILELIYPQSSEESEDIIAEENVVSNLLPLLQLIQEESKGSSPEWDSNPQNVVTEDEWKNLPPVFQLIKNHAALRRKLRKFAAHKGTL